MITWLWPWMGLLLPLPLLVRRWWPPARNELTPLRAPFFDDWQTLEQSADGVAGGARLSTLLLWLLWLCLLLAAARPTWIGDPVQLPASGRDLMLAVDISGSMRVEDMQVGNNLVRRVDAVKAVGAEFIERRRGDRVGLILFGSNAYVQSPLSFDIATVERFLREAQIGFAGQETAIGDAIGLAVKRLRERPAESRVLVLLTDGQDTASSIDPLDAARLAQGLGIRVYTIGIGADQLAVPGIFGSSFGSRRVNPSADLDEESLQAIAEMTGGRYFRARDPQELAGIYQLLDALEPVTLDGATYRPRQALGHWPLLLALLISFWLAAQHGVQLHRQRTDPAGTH
ncbi:VWA domain-containing protein [Haliea sp.]|jgi:Ca-activated chloride channel family protein|uniref:vWA domain-containing protein n=1 Tax=Haliea TaxID=475794 RepID=UPI000C4CFB67|nr:VWA domain-containing protein [Haliea sp.]HAN66943.1 BatB protein [Halieaceae bacterium]MAY94692.1 BatB protein [Haliea sp.]MBP71696.1 BatB protein [Haliea sp.]HBX73727.1 BatB protein [Halieaceae bacterium]HCD56083.1 BatB protein [Halieaceae bacterium]|tara:strand:- start:135 stop:1163 length:1029 start_codon:yes stop_codon:yes gene_type:complete